MPYWLNITKGYGITIKDIDDSCPKDLEVYKKAHEKELIEKDALNHQLGFYTMSAVSTVVSNMLHGKYEYIKEPILAKIMGEINENNPNSESREECGVFEMKQRIHLLSMQGLPASPK